MPVIRELVDVITMKSDRPMRRLLAYYGILAIIVLILVYFFPDVIRALTVSEYLFNAKPNTSNPAPRFAVEQKALPTACVRMALIARSRLIAKLAADKRRLVPLLSRRLQGRKTCLFIFRHYEGKQFRDT